MYSKHVHVFCWKFVFSRFLEPFATFQRNPEIATGGVFGVNFFIFPKFPCPVFEEGFRPDVSFQNRNSFVKTILIATFQNSVVVQAKPSPAVGRQDTKKEPEDVAYGIKLVKDRPRFQFNISEKKTIFS